MEGAILGVATDSFATTLASLLSQWAFALLAGCFAFAVLSVALRAIPSALRDNRFFWLAELIILPLAITYLAALAIAVFGLAETSVWHSRVHEVKGVLQALIFAHLANRALTLFVWQGPLQRYTSSLPGILRNLLTFFIYLAAVYAILAYVFEQPVTGLLVSSGIALGVLGLAFQSTLTDIISGISLAIERPFAVGDWIESDAGICGKVELIDWRATTLRTISNTTHVIPNNKIANTTIHNLSRPGPTYCLKVYVSVSAELPPWKVSRLLLEAAIAAPDVCETPAPIVRMADAEQRPVRYLALLHCADYGDHPVARESFLQNAWRLLDEAGAEFAANTQQLEVRRSREVDFKDPADDVSISGVELFNPLNLIEKKSLIDAGTVHELPAEAQIVRYGEEGHSFFVVLSGMVRIFRPADDDKGPPLELARLGTGSYFGEMSLLTGERRSASVSAHTRARVLEIPKTAMAPILSQRPDLAEDLARIMAQRKLATEGAVGEGDGKGFAQRLTESTRELVQRIQLFFKD